MVLVNGVGGIGMAWSTTIPAHRPEELSKIIRTMLLDPEHKVPKNLNLKPWIKGFKGRIIPKNVDDETQGYIMEGIATKESDRTVRITEIPTDISLCKFREKLDAKRENGYIQYVDNEGVGDEVNYLVHLSEEQMQKAEECGFLKYFNLSTTVPITNMVMFDEKQKLCKFNTVSSIIQKFFDHRFPLYTKRKEKMLKVLRKFKKD